MIAALKLITQDASRQYCRTRILHVYVQQVIFISYQHLISRVNSVHVAGEEKVRLMLFLQLFSRICLRNSTLLYYFCKLSGSHLPAVAGARDIFEVRTTVCKEQMG